MAYKKILFRRDTGANWASINPVLSSGEIGLNLTTNKIKLGDGATAWNTLPYFYGSVEYAELSEHVDVTITDPVSGDFLRWNGSAWINDAVNLGTDTTGSFVQSLTAGTGVTLTNNTGENATPTIAIGQAVATTDSPSFANVTITSAPTNDNHAATKAYVDYHAAGIVWHDSVKLATAGALPGTPNYSNGTSGVGATLTATSNARLIVDGTNATTNDRILVKNQADAIQNGIYKVTDQGSISAPYILTRATDFDASPPFEHIGASGDAAYVVSGAYNANQGFITLSVGTGTNGMYVIGTDEITFGQFTGTATFTAGNGVTITGNTINVESANAGRIVVGGDAIDLALVTRADTTGSVGKSFVQSFTTDAYGRVTASVTADTAITLGTDTSGDYVQSLVASTGITISDNSGEGATPSIRVTANTYDAYGAAATAQSNAESTASGYVATHAALTDVHGVTGTVVGTGNAQTLTNKTLTSPVVDGAGVIFEGAVADDFETTLTVAEPTADRTITLPDATGTVALNGTIALGTDTTGNYMSDVSVQNGLTVSHTPGEGSTATVGVDNALMINYLLDGTAGNSYGLIGTSTYLDIKNTNGYNKEIELDITAVKTQLNTDGYLTESSTSTLTNKTLTSPKINENVALTSTATELNVLDGITSSTAELNILDGATLSTTELNYVDGVTSAIQTQLNDKAPTANPTFTGTVTLAADPASALQAATKQYVDNTAAGIIAKPSVLVASTANVAGVYDNGTLGVGATLEASSNETLAAIDGVTLVVGNGVLLRAQTNAAHNGRYQVTSVGSAGSKWLLTRCSYCDEADEIPGSYIFVQGGSTNANKGFIGVVADPATFTVGTDNIIYTQFSGAGTYVAGAGLVITDNTFDVVTASTDRIVVNANDIDLATTGVSASTYKSVTVDTYGRVTAGTNPTTLSGYGITDAAPINNASFTGTFSAPSGTITSTMIADGTIANADISTTAAIDLGKLADISTNAQAASYTLVLGDKNKIVEMSNASANTLTVPPNSSVAFPIGAQIRVLQTNTGQCTLTPGAGVTINGTPGLKLRTQWASATLIKRATDTWVAVGDLSA